MIYNNDSVRRQDRLLPETDARHLLETGEYGVLSMVSPDGNPYGIPVNFVWDGSENLYIHCAPEGRKLACISHCPEISFCIVGQTHVVSNQFTTAYESVVLRGRAETGLEPEERMHALELLLAKYSPNDQVVGRKYAEKSFHRTEIIRITLQAASGKCKRIR